MLQKMESIRNCAAQLREGKVVLIDNFLPETVFSGIQQIAIDSWSNSKSTNSEWLLSVKATKEGSRTIPVKNLKNIEQINHLFLKACDSDFTYWYYRITNQSDGNGKSFTNSGTISEIQRTVEKNGLSDLLRELELSDKRYQFSMTVFDEFSYLDCHNDYENRGEDSYKLTVILYLNGTLDDNGTLIFHNGAEELTIRPVPNRLVLFVPSSKTLCCVNRNFRWNLVATDQFWGVAYFCHMAMLRMAKMVSRMIKNILFRSI